MSGTIHGDDFVAMVIAGGMPVVFIGVMLWGLIRRWPVAVHELMAFAAAAGLLWVFVASCVVLYWVTKVACVLIEMLDRKPKTEKTNAATDDGGRSV